MITNAGAKFIKEYFAQNHTAIAKAMSFGIGTKETSVNDTDLEFEISRSPIITVAYDKTENPSAPGLSYDRVVFRAAVPSIESSRITEVGLWSEMGDNLALLGGSQLLVDFDSNDVDAWQSATWHTSTEALPTLVGTSALKHELTSAGTLSSALINLALNLSSYSDNDKFSVALQVPSNTPESIQIEFRTDASNYYYYNVDSFESGLNIFSFSKADVLVTGTPTWSNITSIGFSTTSTGASTVLWEAVRLVDTDTANPRYVMIARQTMPVFVVKEGMTNEIEFYIEVDVS